MSASSSTLNVPAASSKKRKRPHVAPEKRQRAAKACDTCRRVKEKCEGGNPCDRCARLKKICTFDEVHPASPTLPSIEAFNATDRINLLHDIVQHYTGTTDLNKTNLSAIWSGIQGQSVGQGETGGDDSLKRTGLSRSQKTTDGIDGQLESTVQCDDPSDLSHSGFAQHLKHQVSGNVLMSHFPQPLHRSDQRLAVSASHLHDSSASRSAIDALPPIGIGRFLIDTFFRIAQTNYSYVDEQYLDERLDCVYTSSFEPTQNDAAGICILLMVFAIGTQFAHLNSTSNHHTTQPNGRDIENDRGNDDAIALQFYVRAKALIPDIITTASVEGVQACLLLGVYTLPVDAGGLSWLYLGLAMKIAISNDLHCNPRLNLTERELETRNKIWWATYTLERRVSVLHGRPMSITRREVSTDLPTSACNGHFVTLVDTTPNVLAMIWLTCFLEDGRERLLAYKQSTSNLRSTCLDSIMSLRDKTMHYWESLPKETYCTDLNPGKPLYRFNVHLALTYHLVHIFIGRFFILKNLRTGRDGIWNGKKREPYSLVEDESGDQQLLLAQEALQHSFQVVQLCQNLKDTVGLSASSYTEYTSCCAALLVILAKRMKQKTPELQQACNQGINLLKLMAVGLYDDNAEKLAVETLERAIHHLDQTANDDDASLSFDIAGSSAYERFRHWASTAQCRSGEAKNLVPPVRNRSRDLPADTGLALHEVPGEIDVPSRTVPAITTASELDFNMFDFDSFLADANDELISMPGMDQWFRYGFR